MVCRRNGDPHGERFDLLGPVDGPDHQIRDTPLEAGVDGFALECEHAEDAFVYSGRVLVGYEPVEGFDSQGELASGQ